MYNTSSCYRSGWLRNNTIILQRKSKVNIIHAKKTHLRVSLLQRRMAVLSKQPFLKNASFRDTHLWWYTEGEHGEYPEKKWANVRWSSSHQRRKVGTMNAHFFLDESILLSTKSTRYYVLVDRNICIYICGSDYSQFSYYYNI